MPINLTMLNAWGKPASTKDAIVAILSRKWPLTAREACTQIKREYALEVSYQAVHKNMSELAEAGVITQQDRNYQLSETWITNLGNFSDGLKEAYFKNGSKYDVDPNFKGEVHLTYNDYSIFVVSTAEQLRRKVAVGNGPNIGTGLFRHLLWPMRFNFLDYELFRRMVAAQDSTYALVENNSPLDKWITKQYYAGGFGGLKTGVPLGSMEGDTIVQGDGIYEIKYSEESREFIDEIYGRNSNLLDLFNEYFLKNAIKKNKVQIDVKISKNPHMASVLRNQVLAHFGGGKNGSGNNPAQFKAKIHA
ncbi:MAG: hypothetical protein V1676_02570 [Candidatus Diapherotrites archaeon]